MSLYFPITLIITFDTVHKCMHILRGKYSLQQLKIEIRKLANQISSYTVEKESDCTSSKIRKLANQISSYAVEKESDCTSSKIRKLANQISSYTVENESDCTSSKIRKLANQISSYAVEKESDRTSPKIRARQDTARLKSVNHKNLTSRF